MTTTNHKNAAILVQHYQRAENLDQTIRSAYPASSKNGGGAQTREGLSADRINSPAAGAAIHTNGVTTA
jgi:hypothetical protein